MTEERKKLTEVKKLLDVAKLKSDIAFSDTDLSTPMMNQASLYAHYAVVSAEAANQVDTFKMLVELQTAKLDQEIRDAAAEAGDKITESKITAAIHRDIRYINIVKKLNESKMIASMAKESLEALKQRRDMLVQIGVTAREEMKGELYLKEKSESSDEKRTRALDVASKAGRV